MVGNARNFLEKTSFTDLSSVNLKQENYSETNRSYPVKTKDREEILIATTKQRQLIYRRTRIRPITDFPQETKEAKRQ